MATLESSGQRVEVQLGSVECVSGKKSEYKYMHGEQLRLRYV